MRCRSRIARARARTGASSRKTRLYEESRWRTQKRSLLVCASERSRALRLTRRAARRRLDASTAAAAMATAARRRRRQHSFYSSLSHLPPHNASALSALNHARRRRLILSIFWSARSSAPPPSSEIASATNTKRSIVGNLKRSKPQKAIKIAKQNLSQVENCGCRQQGDSKVCASRRVEKRRACAHHRFLLAVCVGVEDARACVCASASGLEALAAAAATAATAFEL